MMGHGYMPATSMKKGTNLDEQDLEEQIREEAWTDTWEISLSQAQDIVDDIHMKTQIQNIVDAIAMIKIKETHDVE
jgi:hypothetical protein